MLAGWWGSLGVLLFLGACATGVSGSVPGLDDAGDPPADASIHASIDAGVVADARIVSADAPPAPPDASPPDAHTSTAGLLGLSPSPVIIARGRSATVTVSINQPARAGGEVVALSASSGTAATLPATVTIPEGMTYTTFQVSGVAFGGPFDLSATLGTGHVSVPLRVVPAITMITPSTSDVTVGDTAHYTITLEAASAGALDLYLDSAAPGIASVPVKVTLAAGQSSVGFDVTGVGLGGPVVVTASAGGVSATTRARSLGVYLSEILYDYTSTATGNDTNFEWVELYNAATVPVDITGVQLQSAGGSAGTGYTTSLVLAGTLAPGQCAVVGGPSNVGVTFFQAMDLNPDLGNASSSKADGIRLATATGSVVDAVIYGVANTDMITDEEGAASVPDVGVALANQTIERTAPGFTGPWQVQLTPSPGDCTPISQ